MFLTFMPEQFYIVTNSSLKKKKLKPKLFKIKCKRKNSIWNGKCYSRTVSATVLEESYQVLIN